MKIRLIRSVITALIIIILISLILFLIINREESGSYDFIANFNDAEKTNFPDPVNINKWSSEISYLFEKNYLLEQIGREFSSGTYTFFRKSVWSVGYSLPVTAGAFRAKIYKSSPPDNIILRRDISSVKYWEVSLLSEYEKMEIKVTFYENGKKSSEDCIEIGALKTEYQELNILFFDDFLLIFNKQKLLYQQKSAGLTGNGKIHVDIKSSDIKIKQHVVRFKPFGQKTVENLLQRFTEKSKIIREHKYLFSPDETSWNLLNSVSLLPVKGKGNPFLRRVKHGPEVRPSIYMTTDCSLKYPVCIPNGGKLRFGLSFVPTYIDYPSRIIFSAEVIEGEDLLKEIRIDFLQIEKTYNGFNDYEIDLTEFSGRKVDVIFKVVTKDSKIIAEEGKIITALSAPMIYAGRDKAKNVILVSLDTLRGDRLGCYGYKRSTSPEIDRFAEEGALFTNAISNSNWTLASHMSMFTSFYPYETGFVKGNQLHAESSISDDLWTIAEYLKKAGYATFGVHGGGYVSEGYGFDKGFNIYTKLGNKADVAIDSAIALIEKYKDTRFFSFIHTYEIHEPYTHNDFIADLEPDASLKEKIIAAYDSGIKFTDAQLGRLFTYLKEQHLTEDTLLIITSDHGENFTLIKQDKFCGTHGSTMYDQELRIPIIIGGDRNFPLKGVINKQVSNVDLLPTILDYLDIPLENQVRGRSLLLKDKDDRGERLSYAEASNSPTEKKALRSEKYKLIGNYPTKASKVSNQGTTYEFYNVSEDAEEMKDLHASKPDLTSRFIHIMEEISISIHKNMKKLISRKNSSTSSDEELLKDLKNLGYLGN